jgi:hypothetical protein
LRLQAGPWCEGGLQAFPCGLASSTVSEPPFVYIQWSQAVMLFPVIEACKLVALQTPFTFMQHT